MKWLILFFLTSTLNISYACLSATQNRIYPLGSCPKGLVVVETRLVRTEKKNHRDERIEIVPVWFGVSYFKTYDKNYLVIEEKVIDTLKLFLDKDYEITIEQTFLKGQEFAKNVVGFQSATLLSIQKCNFQFNCYNSNLDFDSLNNTSYIKFDNEKINISMLNDTTMNSLSFDFLQHLKGFDDIIIDAKLFRSILGIASIREYQIGTEKLLVYHLGNRDDIHVIEDNSKKEKIPKFDLKRITYPENVNYHSDNFDFWFYHREKK